MSDSHNNLNVRISPALRRALEKRAAREENAVSSVVRRILAQAMREELDEERPWVDESRG